MSLLDYISYVMIVFAVIAGLDRIFGNKLGLGEEFEKGIYMIAPLTISMAGMLVMAPIISVGLSSIAHIFPEAWDFSIVPAALLANDMGAAHLALDLAKTEEIGYFNGLVVGAMMGCTVCFTIPYSMQVIKKEDQGYYMLGTLCGLITIPIGCIAAGIIAGINLKLLINNLIPLVIFAVILAIGLAKFEKIAVKFLMALGWLMKAVITVGLVAGIIEFLLGVKILPYMDTFDDVMGIIVNIICIMAGAFPLLNILKKILTKVMLKMGGKLGVNEVSSFGLLTTLGTPLTTFETFDDMDKLGIVLNAAFIVSACCVLMDHLAFTMVWNPAFLPAVIIGKLVAGVTAVALAYLVFGRTGKIKGAEPKE